MATKSKSISDRISHAQRKAKVYNSEAQVYKVFEESNKNQGFGPNYKAGRQASEHLANMYEAEAEDLKVREMNSRAQYQHEKAAGDPNATQMSFEEWKKL